MIGAHGVLNSDSLAPRLREEYRSLSHETDPELRGQGLLVFAARLENAGRPEVAAQIYQSLLESGGAGQQEKARSRLAALVGTASFGLRAEQVLGRFSQSDQFLPTIAALAAGGLAFRYARSAALTRLLGSPVSQLLAPWGLRATAGFAGFLVEVPTVTLVGHWGRRLAGQPADPSGESWGKTLGSNAIWLGLLRGVGWGVSGNPWAVSTSPGTRNLLSQGGMLAGAWLGLRLEEELNLSPARSSGARGADALGLLMQFQIAANLSRRMLGAKFRNLDFRLEQRAARRPPRPFWEPGEPLAQTSLVSATGGPARSERNELIPISLSISDKPPSSGHSGGWLQRFRRLFPPAGAESYSDEIIQTVLGISTSSTRFHERLLDALAQAPDRGSRAQWISVRAIEEVFHANSLGSSTASFDYALFQELVQETLKDPRQIPRNQAMTDILQQLRTGLSRRKLDELFAKWGYGQALRVPPPPLYVTLFRKVVPFKGPEEWKDYRPADRRMLLHFVRDETKEDPARAEMLTKVLTKARHHSPYPGKDIDSALDYARDHPQGILALRRLFQIFATRDLPEKIREILPGSHESDSAGLLARMDNLRLGSTVLEREIKGTAHTAYLNNPSLARKVLSVMQEVEKPLSDPSRQEAAKRRLDEAIGRFMNGGRGLAVEDVLNFLGINPNFMVRSLKEKLKAGELGLEVAGVQPANLPYSGISDSVFLVPGTQGGKTRLVIRQLPPFKRSSVEERQRTQEAIIKRLATTLHQFQRWSYAQETGTELGIPRNSSTKPNREEMLVSSILADLEAQNWRIAQGDMESWDIARQIGQPLALYLREKNDVALFRRENERRINALFSK